MSDNPTTSPQLAARVADALSRLWHYLRSWQGRDGRFGGMIATWWSSTVETAVPHPMNQFPVILGLLELHRAGVGGGSWLDEARRVGDGLAGSVDAEGLMENCWGDIPGKGTGPIFFTSCTRALLELYADTANDLYRDAALRMDALVTRRWTRGEQLVGCLVTNQILSWAWSKATQARVLERPAMLEEAQRIARAQRAHRVPRGPLAGGFHQGRFDDRLISVYVGKCAEPMFRIGAEKHDDELVEIAADALRFLKNQEVPDGIWRNYWGPAGPWFGAMRQVTRLDRRVFRLLVPVHKLRRIGLRWRAVDYPSWIARSADSIRAMWELSAAGRFERADAERYTRMLLDRQYPHGGFPNTAGFFGDPAQLEWQDAMPATRWNAYVFLLLCRLAAMLGVERIEPATAGREWETPLLDGRQILRETSADVELRENGALRWRIAKPGGASTHVDPQWRGDLSGHRAFPEIRHR